VTDFDVADVCEDCGVRLDRHGGECGYEVGDDASGYFEPPVWVSTASRGTTEEDREGSG
jgi:hypothetical protein